MLNERRKEYVGKSTVQQDAEINIKNIVPAHTGSSYDPYWGKWR
jgi:hypothetical protein